MEAKFWKIAASLGIPGLALAVFYKLYDKFNWPLASIPPDKMFILVIIFMVIIAVIVVIALVIYRPRGGGEQIVHKYDRLKEGLSSPEQNVSLIQEIANSTDPNKEKYLQEFMDFKDISFVELTATKLALEELRKFWQVTLDAIVPVPPTKVRRFQPVFAVAARLANALGVPFLQDFVRNVKNTKELKNVFEHNERITLLENAYRVHNQSLRGKTVLLFDDLYRSGATLNAVTRVLYEQAQCAQVHAFALTRTRTTS